MQGMEQRLTPKPIDPLHAPHMTGKVSLGDQRGKDALSEAAAGARAVRQNGATRLILALRALPAVGAARSFGRVAATRVPEPRRATRYPSLSKRS